METKSDNKLDPVGLPVGKNLIELLIESNIITQADWDKGSASGWYGTTLGGSIKMKDAKTLIMYSKEKEVICSRSCFLGRLILIKGKIEHFAYLFVEGIASDWNSKKWRRVTDMNEVQKLFNSPDTEMYNQEGYDAFVKSVFLKAL